MPYFLLCSIWTLILYLWYFLLKVYNAPYTYVRIINQIAFTIVKNSTSNAPFRLNSSFYCGPTGTKLQNYMKKYICFERFHHI